MTCNYSDRLDHPRAGDVLDVLEVVYNGTFVDYYRCEWKGQDLDIYEYECDDFVIEIVGDQHVITMKVPDPGGYKKVKAEYLIEPIMSILREDY